MDMDYLGSKNRVNMDYRKYLSDFLSDILEMDKENTYGLLEIPPRSEMGDYAFPCFSLAKVLRKSPNLIAEDLKVEMLKKVDSKVIDKIETAGAYLNFYLNKTSVAEDVLTSVMKSNFDYGKYRASEEDETVIIEYSSPNIAKPFHVGHGFSTVIGAALARIYGFAGYNVVRMNHLGDYGTQFGKLIVAYEKYGNEDELLKSPIDELLRVYVLFHQKLEEEPELETEARERFRKLEAGEKKERELFEKFRDISLAEFKRIYNRLGVDFDNWNGESFYSDKIDEIVDILNEKNLLEESEGALVVRLDELGLPPCLIKKSDGTTIYASRDLASALYRYRTYNFAKNIYVVGLPQSLHFKQVFAVLDKMGFDFAKNCEFVGFGLVKFGDGHFSTRNGNVITLEELLDETLAKTRDIMKKNAEARGSAFAEDELDEISEKIAVAAVLYQYIKNGRERDIMFSWEEMLDFDGDSAPYLQYSGARAHSILRQAGIDSDSSEDISSYFDNEDFVETVSSDFAIDLLKSIIAYKDSIKSALKQNEPFLLARALNNLCRAFNRFYTNCHILNESNVEVRKARLYLTKCFFKILKEGLALLGIEAVERM